MLARDAAPKVAAGRCHHSSHDYGSNHDDQQRPDHHDEHWANHDDDNPDRLRRRLGGGA